ncbi:hypothetical protein AAHA92_05188 [Salvia divinorum]|uniref:Uncharacterized protein n=1 Tax=Salvia divinorum TaxID=28513 RepID=A0ABD1I2T7_SALDI
MARKSLISISLLLLFSTIISSTSARKLLLVAERRRSQFSAVDGSLYLAALPKGTVPNSAPTKRGHSNTIDEKLIARHLAAVDRILRSVPSPGMGH